MHYHLIWLFIIGEVIFCESQYVPPKVLAEVLNISSLNDQPLTANVSKEVITEHNLDVNVDELVVTTTKEELIANGEAITTTEPSDTSTENSKIKNGSLLITTISPNDEVIGTVVTTIKSIVNITLDDGSKLSSDVLKSSNDSMQVPTESPVKEVTSVPKKEADPSLIRPSVVPKKEADPTSLYPSVVGKKGADPSAIKPSATGRKGADPASLIPSVVGKKGADPASIKPSATGRKGADPNSLVPSVHARKGVVYEDKDESESLKNITSPIDILHKTNETNKKEEIQPDAKTQATTSVDIKSTLPVSNEGDKANSSKSSTVPASMGAHKYTPVIKPIPVSIDGSSIEKLEEPTLVEEIHMKPTAATDILGKNLQIEMIVEEEKSSNSGIIIGVILLLTLVTAVVFMGYRHFKEYWMKRHYSRMDFLVEGMYDM